MTRRTLLLIIVAVVLILALVFIVRGRGSSSSATTTPTPTPRGLTAAQLLQREHHAQFVAFARGILPTLQHAATLMDQTAAGVSTASSRAKQFDICTSIGPRVVAVETQASNVPWPPPATPARKWRHSLFGIFHDYLGANVECQNAYDTGDAGQAALAVSDLAHAAREMHQAQSFAQSLVGAK